MATQSEVEAEAILAPLRLAVQEQVSTGCSYCFHDGQQLEWSGPLAHVATSHSSGWWWVGQDGDCLQYSVSDLRLD